MEVDALISQFRSLGLAASLSYGAASEILRRSSQKDKTGAQTGPLLMTEANLNRLVSKLSQMRGAALKIGQFMSIQGMKMCLHHSQCLSVEISFRHTCSTGGTGTGFSQSTRCCTLHAKLADGGTIARLLGGYI